MDLMNRNKIGIVGFSSQINGKLVFRVNGSFEHNDIIQRYWDKKHADLNEDCINGSGIYGAGCWFGRNTGDRYIRNMPSLFERTLTTNV
ncbi:hypothetical protein ACUIJ5_32225 (plasmid) [Bacillus toyonensis]